MQRLQTRAQFQAVLAGSTVARTPHFALHRCRCDGAPACAAGLSAVPGPWIGAMAPKRWARRAVTRNAIKRQIYSLAADFALQWPDAQQLAHLVRLRTGFDRREFPSASSPQLRAALREELRLLFERAIGASR